MVDERSKRLRAHRRLTAERAYQRLKGIVDGDFSAGFFNRPEVMKAEAEGLEVLDGTLVHILNVEREQDGRRRAEELLNRVEGALVHDEVAGRCHTLHGVVALMLDQIGYPAICAWGSVNAVSAGTAGFVLNACEIVPTGGQYRPGHAWLVTPDWFVADIALCHQTDHVGDDYLQLKKFMPPVILSGETQDSDPLLSWWRLPGSQVVPPWVDYANETEYHNLLGWSEVRLGPLDVRYVPGAVSLPDSPDLNEGSVLIGGLRPGDFFEQHLADLKTR